MENFFINITSRWPIYCHLKLLPLLYSSSNNILPIYRFDKWGKKNLKPDFVNNKNQTNKTEEMQKKLDQPMMMIRPEIISSLVIIFVHAPIEYNLEWILHSVCVCVCDFILCDSWYNPKKKFLKIKNVHALRTTKKKFHEHCEHKHTHRLYMWTIYKLDSSENITEITTTTNE